ncbi:hypothetical protein DKT68_02920 [Micromonospora acroterricola]|uniref:Carbamoyltransferase n=1 Tax=Micromonospora acroterricola TaxID=2202421 RepID=A0A317DFW0_9ACTN|nr:carbamoyltransferase C-terminal domain-containing protein [Micromonospora acroterricola]PWR12606.1 hypothetical protein DKT68_02920 [Micromonospora acroterricola]
MDAWLGYSPPVANTGLALKDNGACLVGEDSILLAVSQERLSRIKHDSSLDKALALALSTATTKGVHLRKAAYSTCSDSAWTPKKGTPDLEFPSIAVPSHHYSHALSAYLVSPFLKSLVLVADAGGNVLRDSDSPAWWSAPREQTTLWYGIDGGVTLLERFHSRPYDIGYGEWYRAFTYYLGWPSHTLSGNTMALAAYGQDNDLHEYGIWDDDPSGTLGGTLKNLPPDPISMVKELLRSHGIPAPQPRTPATQLSEEHTRLAGYIQRSLQDSLLRLIEDAIRTYDLDKVCLSGGVAQNCVAAARVAQMLGPGNLFVSGYSADVGQCVGNALHARRLDLGADAPRFREILFLGPEYSPHAIDHECKSLGIATPAQPRELLAREAAETLARGQVVAVYEGRSEFGARALGHRSVLCDPCLPGVVAKVKAGVKRRDDFMPLAPVIDEALATELEACSLSKTMTLAPTLPSVYRNEFGEAMHVDGTARIQVADPQELMGQIIKEFAKITGRRVLINTSFNRRGQPIVETPREAVMAAIELEIDALLLEDRMLYKEALATLTLPQDRNS